MLRAAALGLLLVAGCQPQVMSSGERDSRLHKLFALPCDTTMCGGMWRFDDPDRGVTCYVTAGTHDLISCVRVGDMLEPQTEPKLVTPPRATPQRPVRYQ